MRRLKAMVDRIGRNVSTALWAEALLEAGNKRVKPTGAVYLGANAYNTIAYALMLSLALALARLYDVGSKRHHPNERDVASIPLIIRLLKQKRCQNRLIRDARNWTPHLKGSADLQANACENAIKAAIKAYSDLVRTRAGRDMLGRLRLFRNKQLAHSLIDDVIKGLPTYNDLFALMDVARDVMEHARLAIDGTNEDLKQAERIILTEGEGFWEHALAAVFAADEEMRAQEPYAQRTKRRETPWRRYRCRRDGWQDCDRRNQ
jgi:uncharacterized protein YdiU (UPF0061 family)